MSASLELAFTLPTFGPVVFIKIFLLASSTISTSGPHNSATASTKRKNCSQTTEFGKGGPRASALCRRRRRSTTPSPA